MPSDNPLVLTRAITSGKKADKNALDKSLVGPKILENQKVIKDITEQLMSISKIFEMLLMGFEYNQENKTVTFKVEVKHFRPISVTEVEIIRMCALKYGVSIISPIINTLVYYKANVAFKLEEKDAS